MPRRELPPRIRSHIERAKRTRRIVGALLGLCLLATSAAAIGGTTLAQLPAHLVQPFVDLKLQLPSVPHIAIPKPQLPTNAATQLAAAATSFSQQLTENVRNLFCRWLGCETSVAIESTPQPPQRLNSQPDTLPQNVKPAALNPPARSATTTSVVVSNLPSPSSPASNAKPTQQTVITQPVIERVRETVRTIVQGGVDEAFVDARLAALNTDLTSRMNSLSSANAAQTTNVYNTVSSALRIEELTDLILHSPVIDGATITGGSITAASISGTLSNAISSALATIASLTATDLVATNATTTNATTTNLYVSGTASLPTTSVSGDLTVSGTITGGTLAVAGLSSGGAIEAPYFTATSSTQASTFPLLATTHATTTSLFASSLLSSPTGTFGALTATSSILALGPASFANSSNFFGLTSFGATGTTTIATDGTISTPSIIANSASISSLTAYSGTVGALTATSSLTAYSSTIGALTATSTLAVSNTASFFGSTSFGATATSTFGTNGALTLASALTVPNGGTGWSAIQLGAIPYGNGSSALATTTAGTPGQVLALLNGVPTWAATSTLSTISGTLGLGSGGTATTTFYNGGVVFSDGTKLTQSAAAANFFWDETNKRLGIGTATPGSRVEVLTPTPDADTYTIVSKDSTYDRKLGFYWKNGGAAGGVMGDSQLWLTSVASHVYLNPVNGAGITYALNKLVVNDDGSAGTPGGRFAVYGGAAIGADLTYLQATPPTDGLIVKGNVGIGLTSPTYKLDVSGLGHFTGLVDAANFIATSTSVASLFNGGLLSLASTTIGAGTQAGGLTISGGATTTGNAYFGGSLNLGGAVISYGSNNVSLSTGHLISGYSVGVRGNRGTVYGMDQTSLGAGTGLSLFSNSIESLTINNSGNVGIGDTTPTYKLDVSGTGHFTGLVDAANFVATSTTATSTFAGMLTVGSNALNVLANGNVGIGITSPSTKLEVNGTASSSALVVSTLSGLLKANGASAVTAAVAGTDYLSGTLAKGNFLVGNDAGVAQATSSIFVSSTGNVGIGMTSPLYPLDVTGNARVSNILRVSGANNALQLNGTTPYVNVSDGTITNNFGTDATGGFIGTQSAHSLNFRTSNTAMMTLDTSGNVGIAQTSPTYKLDVTGLGHFTGLVDAANFVATSTSVASLFNGGFLSLASSTIGNGTQSGGLTISGGATTTGTLAITGTSGTTTIAAGQGFAIGTNQLISQQGSKSLLVNTTSNKDNLVAYQAVIKAGLGAGAGGLLVTNNQSLGADGAMIAGTNWLGTNAAGTYHSPTLVLDTNPNLSSDIVTHNGNATAKSSVSPQADNLTLVNWMSRTYNLGRNNTSGEFIQNQSLLTNQSGTTTKNTGYKSQVYFPAGTPQNTSVTTQIDFHAAPVVSSANGAITTRQGLLIDFDDTNVTNAYGVYQSSSGVKNYFNGNLGIATTSPWRTLSVSGTVGFDGLTGATGAGSLCLDSNKQVVYNSASDNCLSSTRATKHDILDLSVDALSLVEELHPVSFVYNEGDGRTRFGFIAEDTAAIDQHLATYNASGTVSGIDDRAIISILVAAIKEFAAKIAVLAESFTTKELIATNASFDALSTKQLCAIKSDGSQVCLTGDQLGALLSQTAGAATSISVPSSPSNISESDPPISVSSSTPDLTNSERPPHENSTTTPAEASADDTAAAGEETPISSPPDPPAPANDNDPAPEAANDNPQPPEAASPSQASGF